MPVFKSLTDNNSKSQKILLGLVFGLALLASVFRYGVAAVDAWLIVFGFGALFELHFLIAPKIRQKHSIGVYRRNVFGWTIAILITFFSMSRVAHALGADWMLFVVWTTYMPDILAYLIGTFLHSIKYPMHLIARHISPKKSWESTVPAIILSTFVCMYVAYFIHTGVAASGLISRSWLWLIVPIVGTAAAIGDFCESALKRLAGVKDSSRILMSHGGFLDKSDSWTGATAVWTIVFFFAMLSR